MISQDHREIYITIAEYDSQYEEFLQPTAPPVRQPVFVQSGGYAGPSKVSRPPTPANLSTSTSASSQSIRPPPKKSVTGTPLKSMRDAVAKLTLTGTKTTSGPESSTTTSASGGTGGFLVMRSFGPWDITQPQDLGNVCKALIALTLHLSQF